jgi:NitT/TauT family transport system substrate-binding protein
MRCPVTQILGVLFTTLFLYASVQAADKIRIAIPDAIAPYLTFPLAQKKGFLKDEGLAAEILLMRPIVQIPSLINGDIDYLTGIPHGVRTAIAGFPVKVMACYLPASTLMLFSRPEIKSVKELNGKTVAISTIGSANFTALQLIAKHFGLDPEKEIKVLAVGTPQARLAALKQGLVAAAIVGPPWDFHARKLGFHVIAKSHEIFSYPQSGLIVNEKKIKERPEEIKRVIRAGIKANRYARSNREGTIQFLMEWMKIDRELATATCEAFALVYSEDGTLPQDGLRLVIEEAKKAAKVDRQVSVSDVADLSILREAQRELGINVK